jgi:hypothetical protein
VALAVVATAPVVAWRLLPDMSTVDETEPNPDYMVRPVDLPTVLSVGIAVIAVVVFVGGLAVLLAATARRRFGPRGWFALALAVMAGFMAALLARMVTAAVIGANIGGGLAVMVFGPVVVIVYAVSLIVAVTGRGDEDGPPIGAID